MLIHALGKCDICGSSNLPFTQQEADTTCLKCANTYKTCNKCKHKGCTKCGGKLESQMESASKHGLMF